MSQNSEQIEAKLCAYLEGELDESGRAEIEKHLQQNPAHRKLLAEVGKTRALLRALPREPAPADICEAFQGQLERSVLLADLDDEGGTSSMKINRWPQYLAVAAVVMLAAGLGMVVYFGLPSGVPDRNVAISTGGGPPGTIGVIEDGGSTTRSLDQASRTVPGNPSTPTDTLATTKDTASLSEAGLPEQLAKKTEGLPSLAAQAPAATAPATNEELTVLARRVQGSWEPRERQRLFAADAATDAEGTLKALENIPATAMCYVVTAADAGQVSDKIGQELSRMQVAWSLVPRPDPAALQTSFALATEAEIAPVAVLRQSADKALEERADPATLTPQRPAAAPSDESLASRSRGIDTDSSRVGRAKQDVVAGAAVSAPLGATRGPTTQPAQEYAASAEKETVLADRAAAPESGGYAFRADLSGRPESLIVARNLTRQQADTLRTALGTQAVEQQVKMYARIAPTAKAESEAKTQVAQGVEPDTYRQLSAFGGAGGGAGEKPAATAAGDAVIRQGDALRLVMAREVGEQTVTEVQVGQNGFATIPGVGNFRCEGLTVAQLHDRLSTNPAAGAADGLVKLVQVTKVEKAKNAPGAAPAEMDAVAAVTEQDVAQRGARRARNDVMLRDGSGGAPARAERGAGQESFAAARPAPAPASSAPAATPAPAEPSSRFAEARGGAAGMAGAAPAQRVSPQAAGVPAPTDAAGPAVQTRAAQAEGFGATQLTTASANADERVDVVIVVRADSPADAMADAPVEPAGPIERFEILTVQLGDTEADSANVRVGDDGTVELPKVGRVKAEGLTAAGLREEIAAKLRANADAAPAEVKVKRLGTSDPADAPAPDGNRQQQQPAAEQPATGSTETPEPAKSEPGSEAGPAPAGGQPRE